MSTYYIENGSSGNQYYFANNAATSQPSSQSYRPYTSPVTFSTNFTTPPPPHHRDPYGYPSQHQSVAGFSKTTTQQYYTSPSPPPPQVRARVRSIGQSDQHHSVQAAPQQHHFQFDSRQQPGHPTGNPVVYQTPGAAQFTHRNVDLWTEGPGGGGNRDHHVQAQRVSVRSVSTGSPTRPQDSLQHYYSQLTPEQHHQLLQRQQQANAHRVEPPHPPPSPRGRVEEQQVIQRQVIQQRTPPQEPPSFHPVGIRSLASKFAGPAPKTLLHHPRSQSNASRQYSTSSYTSRTTTSTTSNASRPVPPLANLPMMTYSALPKSREPPVNSAEYYQMQLQQYGPQGLPNIQQVAAPAHIQHHSPLPSSGQERFRLGSFNDHYPAAVHHPAPAPAPPQSPTKSSGNTLTSLRDQYMHRTQDTGQEEYPAQAMPPVSRSIVGEDLPQQQAPVSKVYQPPQKQQQQQQPANATENQAEEAANEPTDGQTDASNH